MSARIKAIFENGVFEPVDPVRLPEGTLVTIDPAYALTKPRRMNPADVLAEIARLPREGVDDNTNDVAREHDRYPYGDKSQH